MSVPARPSERPGARPRTAVVGAGVSGIVAATELRRAGHEVTVFERSGHVGGRTRTVRFAPDHLLDSGAAWLTTFYRQALRYAAGLPLLSRNVAGTPRVRLTDLPGAPTAPGPFGPIAVGRTMLLTPREKARLVAWVLGNAARGTHVGPRRTDRHDDVDAATFAREHLGEGVLAALLRPAFETMVFAPVDDLSAAFVGNWAAAALTAGYRVPADGMDAPWRRLAQRLDVRTGHEVTAVTAGPSLASEPSTVTEPPPASEPAPVTEPPPAVDPRLRTGPVVIALRRPDGSSTRLAFDGAVVAVPAPVAARILPPDAPGRPVWLDDVRYTRHVFAYGARPNPTAPRSSDIHPVGAGPHGVGSVQLLRGDDGRVPRGWQAGVVSATGPESAGLLERRLGDRDLFDVLWRAGRDLEPALFEAADCRVRHVVRWEDAVPVFGPGHLTRLAAWRPAAPIALAGDWAWYPCVEGAVISGQRAAKALA